MGKSKDLGPSKSFLEYASQLPGASIQSTECFQGFSILIPLRVHSWVAAVTKALMATTCFIDMAVSIFHPHGGWSNF